MGSHCNNRGDIVYHTENEKDKKLQKYNSGIILQLYTFRFMYILRTNPG
jgi:hypothetical protein